MTRDFAMNTGGDFYSAKLLFNTAYYVKTSSASSPDNKNLDKTAGGEIYLHEVIKGSKAWEFPLFWDEYYWGNLLSPNEKISKIKLKIFSKIKSKIS